ncbi:NS2 [Ambidensovirus CaaDV1]|uniref:NS2 n=1 Tax=Crassostrea ariakensis ambidensovirus 1 TaxID=2849716 RepID=A0A1W5YP63_9VIRU|nr:NS2 [Ambidensovirus CaaDV1]ARI46482.1 NS2 [Crassostrea ariakensis ambidensovirus 1]
MMSDVEKNYVSESEEEILDEGKIQFASLLNRILQAQPPLSQDHPGFLIGFVKYLETQDDLPTEIENCLRGLIKAGKIWSNATPSRLKKGVIEYLESCKSLMGTLFETSFDSRVMKSLKTFLDAFKEMNITEEDCSSYVSMVTTSTSHTTATSATGRAGATGGRKRKLLNPSFEEIDVDLEDVTVEVEPSPTWKCYSGITALKDGRHYSKKSEDKWKEYHMKVTLYRKKDLMKCPSAKQKWDYRFMELEVNFDKGDAFSQMMSRMRALQEENLDAKNASWEPVKRFRYE